MQIVDVKKQRIIESERNSYADRLSKRMFQDLSGLFCHEVTNDAMRYFGIFKGAVLIVHKQHTGAIGRLVVCEYFGEILVRKLCLKNEKLYLCINNTWEGCTPVMDEGFEVLGLVAWVCKQVLEV